MLKAVLFDLDGTLLPMQMDQFIKTYFGAAGKTLGPKGMNVEKMFDGLWKGTEAMVANDGSRTNETCFWDTFVQIMGEDVLRFQPDFEDFYRNEFEAAKAVTKVNPEARAIVDWLKARGIRLAVATNPVFPMIAQQKRLSWAGFQPEEFEWITSYENSHYCKPNPAYYQEILDRLGLQPSEALMVGNDITEDMAAQQLGMPVFLSTECLWNPKNLDTAAYPRGSFEDLKQYLTTFLPRGGQN